MTKAQLRVHTENILPIIKKWLYSDRDIFIRELVSNACDALSKCRVLREQGEASILDEELRITIRIDKEKKQLIVSDTGIGMTAEEVETYIAQIAFSGAEDFVSRYQSKDEKDQIIGHFGLGFYSAYMVSSRVCLQTRSYKEGALPVYWSCDGSTEYEIETGERQTRGTDVILDIDAENEEFLEEARVRHVLAQYCQFLPFPIFLNETAINPKEPLWLRAPNTCTEEEYLEFYRSLYPLDPDPMFYVHLNVDYPFRMKGILYFPKIGDRFDWTKSHIKLFCNRVFVSENCKDLLPDYLTSLKGTLDSPDIPLNVSRSYLQMDKTVRQLGTHVSKKIADKLSTSYQEDKEKFLTIWPDIELIIKLGVIQDEKFQEKSQEFLVWKSTNGAWTTIEEYLERNAEKLPGKIFYTMEEGHSSSVLQLYKDKGIEVLFTHSSIDSAVLSTVERKKEGIRFQRIDGQIEDSLLDKDAMTTLDSSELSALIADKIGNPQVSVEAKSLASQALPGFLVIDEDMRRMKEYMSLSKHSMPSSLFDKKTFVVNTNHKLIAALPELNAKDPELTKDLVLQLYELSMLSQKELDPASLPGFVERSSRILEKLLA